MTNERDRLHVFNGQNFLSWEVRIEALFESLSIEGVLHDLPEEATVAQATKYTANERRARFLIIERLDDTRNIQVSSLKRPKEIMDKLRSIYCSKNSAAISAAMNEIETMKYKDGQSMEEHITKFESAALKLANLGSSMSDAVQAQKLIDTLPEKSWDTTKSSFNVIGATREFTLEEVERALQAEYETRHKSNGNSNNSNAKTERTATSFQASGNRGRGNHHQPNNSNNNRGRQQNYHQNRNYRNNNDQHHQNHQPNYHQNHQNGRGRGYNSNYNSNPNATYERKCFRCNQMGHIGRYCPKFGDYSKPHQPSNTNTNDSSNSASASTAEKNNYEPRREAFGFGVEVQRIERQDGMRFLFDSGATDHIVNDDTYLSNNVRECDVKINVAKKGESVCAKIVGNVVAKSQNNVPLVLNDVLYAPEISRNLLSMPRVMQSGLKVVAFGDRVDIIDPNSNVIIARGNLRDSKIFVDLEPTCQSPKSAMVTGREIAAKWHARMGHLNFKYLNILKKVSKGMEEDVDYEKCAEEFCTVCKEAKQKRQPFDETRERATRVLGIIHADLLEVNPKDADDTVKKYVLTITDDYSRYAISYLLQNKSETAESIIDYVRRATAMHNCKVGKLRCDKGGEFTSDRLKTFCANEGICIQYAATNIHQHNGVAERMNALIMNTTRAQLFNSGLPRRFWEKAVANAIFIIDRSPSSSTGGKTRFELWRGYKPKLDHMRIFGSVGYWKKESYDSKVEERSIMTILVGHTETGYELWDPAKNVIFEGRHVEVNENVLYRDLNIEPNPNVNVNSIEVEIFHVNVDIDTPLTYEEAVHSSEGKEWSEAIQRELKSMDKHKVYELVNESEINLPVMDTTWVFNRKINTSGQTIYKARLAVKGFQDPIEHEISATYSPVPKLDAVRLLLSLAIQRKWIIIQADVVTAFLHAKLEYDAYCKLPKGFPHIRGKVWKLLQSLYGLKVSAKNWYNLVHAIFTAFGLIRLITEPCIYVSKDGKLIAIIYVDDFFILGITNEIVDQFIKYLESKFELKVLGKPKKFLGLNFNFINDTLEINQNDYIKAVLKRFNLIDCHSKPLPADPAIKMKKNVGEATKKPFRNIIGCLNYIAAGTRPDISFITNSLARHQNNPSDEHFAIAKNVLRYLAGTMNLSLKFSPNESKPILEMYVDASYVNDYEERSSSGVMIHHHGNLIAWKTKIQPDRVDSSGIAEYVAMYHGIKLCRGIRNQLQELLSTTIEGIPIHSDSSAAISIISTLDTHSTKQIKTAYLYAKEAIDRKEFEVRKISKTVQIADLLTKTVTKKVLTELRNLIFYNRV